MIAFSQDWAEWFVKGYNWQEFTFVKLFFENDKVLGAKRFECALFGLHAQLTVYGPPTPTRNKIERDMLIMQAHPDVAVKLQEIMKEVPDVLERIQEHAQKHAPKEFRDDHKTP